MEDEGLSLADAFERYRDPKAWQRFCEIHEQCMDYSIVHMHRCATGALGLVLETKSHRFLRQLLDQRTEALKCSLAPFLAKLRHGPLIATGLFHSDEPDPKRRRKRERIPQMLWDCLVPRFITAKVIVAVGGGFRFDKVLVTEAEPQEAAAHSPSDSAHRASSEDEDFTAREAVERFCTNEIWADYVSSHPSSGQPAPHTSDEERSRDHDEAARELVKMVRKPAPGEAGEEEDDQELVPLTMTGRRVPVDPNAPPGEISADLSEILKIDIEANKAAEGGLEYVGLRFRKRVPAKGAPSGVDTAEEVAGADRKGEEELPLTVREKRKRETQDKYLAWNKLAHDVILESEELPKGPLAVVKEVKAKLLEDGKREETASIHRRLNEHFPRWFEAGVRARLKAGKLAE